MATFAQFKSWGPYFSGGSLCTLRVYHYVAGTTTDKDMYTTRTKSATVAQPLESDSDGIARAYADGLYKIRIDGSTDGVNFTTLYTDDNVAIADQTQTTAGEGAALNSASTLTLGNDGDWFHVDGATGITALSGPQSEVTLVFNSTPTLTHSGSLILQNSANYTAAAGDALTFKNEGSGVWREIGRANSTTGSLATANATVKGLPSTLGGVGTSLRVTSSTALTYGAPAGHLHGLTLSNNGSDATNDIDIAVGEATSTHATYSSRVIMALTSALTKRLDASWAAGTNQGGLASSLVAGLTNTTYHVFLIRVNGSDDIGFDTSVTAANLVADHSATHFRRIGSILRESAAIVAFVQDGDYFRRKTGVLDINTTNPGTNAVSATLSVPGGIKTEALFNCSYDSTGVSNAPILFSDPDSTDETPSNTAAPLGSQTVQNATSLVTVAWHRCRTNTSSQIRYRISSSGGSVVVKLATIGWLDSRGRVN